MFGGGCRLLNQDILASKSPIMCNLGFLIWWLILQHYPNPRSIFNLRKRLACLIVNPLVSLSLRLNVYFNEFNPDMNYHNWRSSLLRIQIYSISSTHQTKSNQLWGMPWISQKLNFESLNFLSNPRLWKLFCTLSSNR